MRASRYNLEKSERESQRDWTSESFEWASKAQEILEKRFRLKEFRPKQLAAINATLSKKDVLLLMPTGGGKSLVYQLPALVQKGLTVVISPLLSLIEDQVIALRKLGISAEALNSSSSKETKKRVYDYMGKGLGEVKLIYVTPEWVAKSKMFMSYLQKCDAAKRLDRIAIGDLFITLETVIFKLRVLRLGCHGLAILGVPQITFTLNYGRLTA